MSDARVLDNAPWLRSGPAARVLKLLNGNGEEARVVGGAVRNALLKIPIGDIDIATTALPAEVIRRAKAAGIKSVPTGIDHGTVTLVVDAHPFEVTTLREDTETFGRKAKVAFGRDWVRRCGAARLHHQRPVGRRRWRRARSRRRTGRYRGQGACASSAIRTSGSPRIICASSGFSAFTPPIGEGRARSRRISRLHRAGGPALRRFPPNACAWKC